GPAEYPRGFPIPGTGTSRGPEFALRPDRSHSVIGDRDRPLTPRLGPRSTRTPAAGRRPIDFAPASHREPTENSTRRPSARVLSRKKGWFKGVVTTVSNRDSFPLASVN